MHGAIRSENARVNPLGQARLRVSFCCVRVSGWLLPFWHTDFRTIFSVAVQCVNFETPIHRVLFGLRPDHRRLAVRKLARRHEVGDVESEEGGQGRKVRSCECCPAGGAEYTFGKSKRKTTQWKEGDWPWPSGSAGWADEEG